MRLHDMVLSQARDTPSSFNETVFIIILGWEFFSSPPSPEGLWRPHSLLSNGYQGLFLWG